MTAHFHLFAYGTLTAPDPRAAADGTRPDGTGASATDAVGTRAVGTGAVGTRAVGTGVPGPLAGCQLAGEATIRGTLYDIGPYPALLLAGNDPVPGQIWRCPAERLPDLDRYEATAQGLFRRVGIRVGNTACWVYVAGPRLATRLTPDARLDPTS